MSSDNTLGSAGSATDAHFHFVDPTKSNSEKLLSSTTKAAEQVPKQASRTEAAEQVTKQSSRTEADDRVKKVSQSSMPDPSPLTNPAPLTEHQRNLMERDSVPNLNRVGTSVLGTAKEPTEDPIKTFKEAFQPTIDRAVSSGTEFGSAWSEFVKTPSRDNINALWLASLAHSLSPADRTQLIESLVPLGVNLNAEDKHGTTALMFAIQQNDLELAKQLIEKGAKVNYVNSQGMTPLRLLAQQRYDQEFYDLLSKEVMSEITNTVSVLPPSNQLKVAWNYFVKTDNLNYARDAFILAFREENLDPEAKNALLNLLFFNFDVKNATDRYGMTALMHACLYNMDIALKLIEAGVNVKALSTSGLTPLMFLAHRGDKQTESAVTVLHALLDKGADVSIKAPNKKTAYDYEFDNFKHGDNEKVSDKILDGLDPKKSPVKVPETLQPSKTEQKPPEHLLKTLLDRDPESFLTPAAPEDITNFTTTWNGQIHSMPFKEASDGPSRKELSLYSQLKPLLSKHEKSKEEEARMKELQSELAALNGQRFSRAAYAGLADQETAATRRAARKTEEQGVTARKTEEEGLAGKTGLSEQEAVIYSELRMLWAIYKLSGLTPSSIQALDPKLAENLLVKNLPEDLVAFMTEASIPKDKTQAMKASASVGGANPVLLISQEKLNRMQQLYLDLKKLNDERFNRA